VIASRFKGTVYADLAQARIGELKKEGDRKKLASAAGDTPAPKQLEETCIEIRGSITETFTRKEIKRGKVGRV
jgi:hypothetical protein